MATKSYRDLVVWQRAMQLVVAVYEITGQFPPEERFGLTSQMRRAAVSIPSNIAEGYQRHSRKEYVHFLTIAFASGAELETHVELSKRLPQLLKLDYNSVDGFLLETMKLLNVNIARFREAS